MGAIPAIIRFWGPKRNSTDYYSPEVRKETVRFLKKMVWPCVISSFLRQQMKTLGENFFLRNFISNQALPALKGLLEPTTEFKTNSEVSRSYWLLLMATRAFLRPFMTIRRTEDQRYGVFTSCIRSCTSISASLRR